MRLKKIQFKSAASFGIYFKCVFDLNIRNFSFVFMDTVKVDKTFDELVPQ